MYVRTAVDLAALKRGVTASEWEHDHKEASSLSKYAQVGLSILPPINPSRSPPEGRSRLVFAHHACKTTFSEEILNSGADLFPLAYLMCAFFLQLICLMNLLPRFVLPPCRPAGGVAASQQSSSCSVMITEGARAGERARPYAQRAGGEDLPSGRNRSSPDFTAYFERVERPQLDRYDVSIFAV